MSITAAGYRAQEELEDSRYRLCMYDRVSPDIRDQQTIEDIDGLGMAQGLERFLRRRGKTLEMMSR